MIFKHFISLFTKRITCLIILSHLSIIVICQPSDYYLVTNTLFHTDIILNFDTDPSGRYIITCSFDKTAKLWDAESMDLIRTFRVPIKEGVEGKLFACAISPNCQIVALGGGTGCDFDSEGLFSIYLFNIDNGELIYKLNRLPAAIIDLEFSEDGKFLAVSLIDNTVVIYQTGSWTRIKTLNDFGDVVIRLEFNEDGLLATTCVDGKLRLFSSSFNIINQKQYDINAIPTSISFFPGGEKFALGSEPGPNLEVLDLSSLNLLYRPDYRDINTINAFSIVAYSNDGNYLFAGGDRRDSKSGLWVIRRWEIGGKGSFQDYQIGHSAIRDIQPLQNKVGIITSYPELIIMDYFGNKLFAISSELKYFHLRDRTHFRVNYSGSEISFKSWGSEPVFFSLPSQQLEISESLFPYYTDKVEGVNITNWTEDQKPKINGKYTIDFKSLCVDISEETNRIVFGGLSGMLCTDFSGNIMWESEKNIHVCAINISGDGKCVVGALTDGTICWVRMSDGVQILKLLVHPDNERWILWTPSGYYNCYPGAENLIGWHVNNGPDQAASFYPLSKFRNIYYRPDVIDKISETLDENEALRLANLESNRKSQVVEITQMLPPTISIVTPGSGTRVNSNNISIQYRVQSPNGKPVLGVKVLIDGRPPENARGFKPVGNEGTIIVTIPSQDCKVSLIAENINGFSDPAVINLYWKGVIPIDILKPKLYLLAIGISNYDNPDLKLKLAAKDARDFTAAILRQKGLLYEDVVVRLLTDKDATKDNILEGLDWVQRETTHNDVAMIYLGGHGLNDNIGNFYFLPVGADPERVRTTCLMFGEIKITVAAVSGKIVVFADACHSGNILGGRKGPDINGLVNELSSVENGAIVFTSSTGNQYSLEDLSWGNGAFTKALVEGLNGKADLFGKGTITVKTLDAYVSERVKALTKGQQSPTTIIPNNVPDFPIAVVE